MLFKNFCETNKWKYFFVFNFFTKPQFTTAAKVLLMKVFSIIFVHCV